MMTDAAKRETLSRLGAGVAGALVVGNAGAQNVTTTKYVDAFMRNVNWEEVNRRFAKCASLAWS